MSHAINCSRAVHGMYTLYYRFVGRDQGHCVMLNAVDEQDAQRQARRYHVRHRALADAALYDHDGEVIADTEDLQHVRAIPW